MKKARRYLGNISSMYTGEPVDKSCRIRAERRRVVGIDILHIRREQRQACDERFAIFFLFWDFHREIAAHKDGTRVLCRALYAVSIFRIFFPTSREGLLVIYKNGVVRNLGSMCISSSLYRFSGRGNICGCDTLAHAQHYGKHRPSTALESGVLE